MIRNIKSNILGLVPASDILNLLSYNMLCEDVAVYDKVMSYCDQLDISVHGNRNKLTIIIYE